MRAFEEEMFTRAGGKAQKTWDNMQMMFQPGAAKKVTMFEIMVQGGSWILGDSGRLQVFILREFKPIVLSHKLILYTSLSMFDYPVSNFLPFLCT